MTIPESRQTDDRPLSPVLEKCERCGGKKFEAQNGFAEYTELKCLKCGRVHAIFN